MFDASRYAGSGDAESESKSPRSPNNRPSTATPPLPYKDQRLSRVISRTFDVDATTQSGDDDDGDEDLDALLESSSKAHATAAIVWSNRGDQKSGNGAFDLAATAKAVKAFEAKGERGAVEARHNAIRQLLASEEAYTAKLCQVRRSCCV